MRNRINSGADDLTPSIPQYFSWINNTNEGSTEKQTLVNLDFFRMMKEEFGMEIKIYALDAGNFDGASGHYGAQQREKLEKQYPDGYKNMVEKAASMGIRLGLWGSPDGYGDDEDTQKERFEFFVHLCRDYNFAEFKLDGVCGTLRPEKAGVFAEMLRECRKYSPDLLVLNHRLEYYEADDYISTDLWNGEESYTDICCWEPEMTAMHHRARMFGRGHTDNLKRMMEDHGVCISSCIDYFEDELIYQAFGRSLILAPEIYGNPWLMRDDELPRLARIYNLHARNSAILVNGMLLPEEMGCHAVSRGCDDKRFIQTGNDKWQTKTVCITLDESIGLKKAGSFVVNLHHPTEKRLGEFSYGDTVKIELMPFRATLIEVAVPEKSEIMLEGCEYEIVKEAKDGTPLEIVLFSGETDVTHRDGRKEAAPEFVCSMTKDETTEKSAALYEGAVFGVDNDALEARSLKRAGETKYPEVRRSREAFFAQDTYRLRGCEAKAMFDGDDSTFFDYQSRDYRGIPIRVNGGCLRIDFGKTVKADRLEITCFTADEKLPEIPEFTAPGDAKCGNDFSLNKTAKMLGIETVCENYTQDTVVFTVHNIIPVKGRKLKITYEIPGELRYFALPCPPDRIYSVKLFCGENELDITNAHANNIQAAEFEIAELLSAEITLPENCTGRKLCVAIEGDGKAEDRCCVLEVDGQLYCFDDRAPSYRANMWEHNVNDDYYPLTFFRTLDDTLAGKRTKVYAMFGKDSPAARTDIYLADLH